MRRASKPLTESKVEEIPKIKKRHKSLGSVITGERFTQVETATGSGRKLTIKCGDRSSLKSKDIIDLLDDEVADIPDKVTVKAPDKKSSATPVRRSRRASVSCTTPAKESPKKSKIKKHFNLEAANADLKKRQDLYKKSEDTINGLWSSINGNYNCMAITIPEDKKKILTKEMKAVEEKLEVLGRFKGTVTKIEELVASLTEFDNSLKAIDGWMQAATAELNDIKTASGSMLPEDRVARTMDLQANTKIECDKYSN